MLILKCSILCMFIVSVIWSSSQPVDLCSHTSTSKLSIPNPMKHIVQVTQSCLTLCDPMDYVVHGILQARILEWVAFPNSRGSSQPRDQTQVSHIAGRFFTSWATREAQGYCAYPIPSLAILPDPGIEPESPAFQTDSLPTELWRKPRNIWFHNNCCTEEISYGHQYSTEY